MKFRKFIYLHYIGAVFCVILIFVSRSFRADIFLYCILICYPYLTFFIAYKTTYLRRLNEIGDFSYGIYIYGWFSQNIAASFFGPMSPKENFVSGLLLSLVFAIPSWFIIEKPAMQYISVGSRKEK